jgi:hypothetical protein
MCQQRPSSVLYLPFSSSTGFSSGGSLSSSASSSVGGASSPSNPTTAALSVLCRRLPAAQTHVGVQATQVRAHWWGHSLWGHELGSGCLW